MTLNLFYYSIAAIMAVINITIITILLLSTIFMIFRTYGTELTGQTFLTNTYLYILAGLLFVALIAKYMENSQITQISNTFSMVLVYFILAFGGISLMTSSNMLTNHIGYIMLLVALSLSVSTIFRYSDNVVSAAVITAVIMAILTFIVYNSSDETIAAMANWSKYLTWILIILIFAQIAYLFFYSTNRNISNILAILIIVLFIFYILSDTSRLLQRSKNLVCQTHQCVNYPMQASGLLLDYINIFVRLVRRRD